jgi:hypothetical protein
METNRTVKSASAKWDTVPVGSLVKVTRGAHAGTIGLVRSHVNAGFRGMEHGVQGVPGTWGLADLEIIRTNSDGSI